MPIVKTYNDHMHFGPQIYNNTLSEDFESNLIGVIILIFLGIFLIVICIKCEKKKSGYSVIN